MYRSLFFIFILLCLSPVLFAQQDTTKPATAVKPLFKDSSSVLLKDSTKKIIADTAKAATKLKHDPRKATFRSAVLPGWGQIYNREYWKLPIVYGALAIPASLYIYNNNYYHLMKFAYEARYALDYLGNDSLAKQVSSKVKSSEGQLFTLSTYQSYRNSFKRNKDYSLLWFLILWGVNVADATVFGHLKEFDVSDDLSLEINPSYIPATKSSGVNLVFSLKNPVRKPLPSF